MKSRPLELPPRGGAGLGGGRTVRRFEDTPPWSRATPVTVPGWVALRASRPDAPPSSPACKLQPCTFPARPSAGAAKRSLPIRSSDRETCRLSVLSAVRLPKHRSA